MVAARCNDRGRGMKKRVLVLLVLAAFPVFGQSGLFNPFGQREIDRWKLSAGVVYLSTNSTAAGKLYSFVTNGWALACSTNPASCSGLLAVALSTNSARGMQKGGMITAQGLTPGLPVFISATPGEFTQTQPTNSGYVVRSLCDSALTTNSFELAPGVSIELQ